MAQPHIAYCGFNCAACPVFHAAARSSSWCCSAWCRWRQRRTAAACSALFRARAPASAWPDGLCRLPQRCSGRVLRRVRHAHMRRGARPCTLCRMRRISLRHCEKKPTLRQRRPRGAGRPALKRPVLWRFARPLFCAKNAACIGRASTEKHAFFAGAIKSQP